MSNTDRLQWREVLCAHVGPTIEARLAQARVGIVGAGGLGSNCAGLLVRSGIRRLVVADADVVSASNLNRQFFTPKQIGRPKVDALKANLTWMLAGSLPLLEYVGHVLEITPEAVSLFEGCDVVVEAVDSARTKRMLVETLLDAGHVVISASGMAGWGGDMRRRRLGKLSVVGDGFTEVGPGSPPMAPRVMMAAAMQADEVLWRLLEKQS